MYAIQVPDSAAAVRPIRSRSWRSRSAGLSPAKTLEFENALAVAGWTLHLNTARSDKIGLAVPRGLYYAADTPVTPQAPANKNACAIPA